MLACGKRCTAVKLGPTSIVQGICNSNAMSYNYHYTTIRITLYASFWIDPWIELHQLRKYPPVEGHSWMIQAVHVQDLVYHQQVLKFFSNVFVIGIMFGQGRVAGHLLSVRPKLTSIHLVFASVLDVNSVLSGNEHQFSSRTSKRQFLTKPW